MSVPIVDLSLASVVQHSPFPVPTLYRSSQSCQCPSCLTLKSRAVCSEHVCAWRLLPNAFKIWSTYRNIIIFIILYIQRKIFFRRTFFFYSPCPNLEGIKDALSYKFRRLTIGQNCCAVCTNEVARAGAIETHSRARATPRVSTGLLGRSPSLERSERRGLCFVIV